MKKRDRISSYYENLFFLSGFLVFIVFLGGEICSELVLITKGSPGLSDFYTSRVINITFSFPSPITKPKGS